MTEALWLVGGIVGIGWLIALLCWWLEKPLDDMHRF